MVIHECPRCLYSSSKKGHLRDHLSKKGGKCKIVKGGIDLEPEYFLKLLDNPISMREYAEMELRIKELEKKIEQLTTNKQNTVSFDGASVGGNVNVSVDASNHTVNNIQFIINAYNEPNTAYILSKHADAALKSGNLLEGCIQMARLIWFNGNHPENHSIFKTNKKDDSIKCLEDHQVNEYTLDSKFRDIMEIILTVFERSEKESERYYDLNDIFDNPDKHEKFYRRLERDLAKELYNHKELVKQTIAKFQKRQLN